MGSGKAAGKQLLAIDGVRLAACHAGIRYSERLDLSVIEVAQGASLAAVFTQNAFSAAPVQLAKMHLARRSAQEKTYLLINSGNANAGTGQQGFQNALDICEHLAKQFSCSVEQVLPFSTGVIGEQLPLEKMLTAVSGFSDGTLSIDAWSQAADAILTTDTCRKTKSIELELDGHTVRLTGIAKGSGMIKPNMATMLAYIATDAEIDQSLLESLMREVTENSFNSISVDGDTSTNDAFVLMATGKSGVRLQDGSAELKRFCQALEELALFLAHSIVRDGEGASKFIEVSVEGGKNKHECKEVAYTIAHSPLVKTAFFASDPNWGRILAALGRAPLDHLDISRVDISLGETHLIENGELASTYTEEKGAREMQNEDISVFVNLNRGKSRARVWTCDFSYDYVKINAEYRS